MNDLVIYFTGAVNTIFHYVDSTFSGDPNIKLAFFVAVCAFCAICLWGLFACVKCALSALCNSLFKGE